MKPPRFNLPHLLIFIIIILVFGVSGCAPLSPSAEENSQAGILPQSDIGPDPSIESGFTSEGFPYLGNADAPVTLVEYSDYLCPFCGRHFAQTYPTLVDQYIRTGKVKLVFRDFPIAELHPNAPAGHLAAQCVAEQGIEKFWKMHDLLFRSQESWAGLSDPTQFLAEQAQLAGADLQQYQECIQSGRTKSQLQQSIQDGQSLGFNGTPSFQFFGADDKPYVLIGAQPVATFQQWIETLLAGEVPAAETVEPTVKPELPYWAKPEGLAPDPERPGFTMAGDPYQGNPESPLVVVEFSDFQCPACAEFYQDAQPTLKETFVDTGKVLWVYKNMPLKQHAQAVVAAVAAECAGEQNKFWELHDLLYSNQDVWAIENPDALLVDLAKQTGIDEDMFRECFNSRQALEHVLTDMYDSQGIVDTTPTFIVLHGEQGTVIRGNQPLEDFISIIQQLIEDSQSTNK